MNILVLGAGVVGTACAHYLNRAGHRVTVVERRSGAGLETSFGNAGGVCPGFAGPWAAPGMPVKALKWMLDRYAPLAMRPTFDPHQYVWLAAFLKNCSVERYARNKARMQRIAHYSKACLVALRAETGIAYDHGEGGVLQLFRTADEVAGGRRASAVLEKFGVVHQLLDADGVLAAEPALARASVSFAGGLNLPGDETGDSALFTARLAERLQGEGVRFLFDTTVKRLRVDGKRLRAVETDRGVHEADAVVVALGVEAPFLLRPLGLNLPIYPVKGYSITVDLVSDQHGPRSAVMDEHSKVMISRLGTRLRAAGMAEVAGYSLAVRPDGIEAVRRTVRAIFPDAAVDSAAVAPWAGLRPMTPDGPPYLGPTPIEGLYLNIGHGSNGWTQACGSGRIVADIVSGRTPEIDLEGYGLAR
ncbi:D-amino acid dehydrogenase [Rhodoplanes sp. TEM]|uniref:D-amino acid dehydrogenase n=1 Tax=Rhodoplanes tepidamans TaxID=200616 RepID=A0ABT5JBI4_RHOTP|nr:MULTISPECIES: D-amino acid dehydrogenase [Rhodoplanes]MDC7786619.1 D-amino acid dehydrogenase [Rhodoplanes tepidamans]MDC7983034.1 D-amino acid dehydrogenase [Rhodoplanes sp. TEM]MDQ0356416.1 D-amino-acid dehydrogenase [Rhodoplanes tepidamans]